MITRRLPVIALFLLPGIGAYPSSTFAQVTGAFGLEGHVFNRSSGKPLQGARIDFTQTVMPDGPALGSEMITDEGGLFWGQISILSTDPSVVNQIAVTCNTRRGSYSSALLFYNPLQSQVYHRDVYLNVPGKITRCGQ